MRESVAGVTSEGEIEQYIPCRRPRFLSIIVAGRLTLNVKLSYEPATNR